MNEEAENENSGGNTKQTIDAVTALIKEVPIYEDAVQPFAKETGKALATVGKAVNVALSPISLLVWSYDEIKDFVEKKVTEKLKNVPENRMTTPPLNVVGPAVEALRFTGQEETLKDMFANLIANSLDSKTVLEAHPSFVDIIKSLSPDEGLILKIFKSALQFPVIDIKKQAKKDKSFDILRRNVSQIGFIAGCKHKRCVSSKLSPFPKKISQLHRKISS
ncbi:MAG: DUF4393 domain-containing protein [Desulfobacteraceae bacterium]|nr:DUF4393 domain-containing protein [Desulfobacteraceae bacterium]